MLYISGNNINATIFNAFKALKVHGDVSPSRNGDVTQLFDTTFHIDNPRSRHLSLDGRKSNIFQLIAETLWVMSGSNAIDPYLSFFLPRAKNYSDDGLTWHGAYGPRMYAFNQISDAIKDFEEDGINTRRSTITISDLSEDSKFASSSLYGEGHKLKDKPCNREINFYVKDDKFCAKTIQRSGDMLFGAGSINPFEFTFLQELMFNEVKKIHPTLELGHYRWHVTNAHVYSEFYSQVEEVLSKPQSSVWANNDKRLIAPSHNLWEEFFTGIVVMLSSMIVDDNLEESSKEYLDDLIETWTSYDLPFVDNLLWDYVHLTYTYILSKRLPNLKVSYTNPLSKESVDLNNAIFASSFRNFSLEG